MGVYDEQLNLVESPNDRAFLRTIKKILRKSEYRYLKSFRRLFDNESDMNDMRRAIEKPSHGKISLYRTKYILDKLGLKYSVTCYLKLTIYLPGGEIIEAFEDIDVKSLYPSIKMTILQESKSTTQNFIEDMIQKRNELKQNNSFELKKIKVFLPGDLYKKNKEKDFKYLELHFNSDVWNMVKELEYLMHNQRIIQINTNITDEPGYNYKPINFNMYDLSDEEFDEFLKIFNLQGSCTSKISL